MTIDISLNTKRVPTPQQRFRERYQYVYRLPRIQALVRTAQKSTTLRV
ncbi:hypothetical protein [Bradyrhizobium sp. JYMT SZCCT0428]|nr:hypothetical protein [Bradyrhizobium sp. JYMT SZCCT0428]MBR1154435.1 hypothetical protein [Bradyrhizobium sp. JYMT SZCCT0428]